MKLTTDRPYADPEAADSPAEYGAGLDTAIAKGWLWKHESGVYVKFIQVGAELFA